jgi:hypothetical protein
MSILVLLATALAAGVETSVKTPATRCSAPQA